MLGAWSPPLGPQLEASPPESRRASKLRVYAAVCARLGAGHTLSGKPPALLGWTSRLNQRTQRQHTLRLLMALRRGTLCVTVVCVCSQSACRCAWTLTRRKAETVPCKSVQHSPVRNTVINSLCLYVDVSAVSIQSIQSSPRVFGRSPERLVT